MKFVLECLMIICLGWFAYTSVLLYKELVKQDDGIKEHIEDMAVARKMQQDCLMNGRSVRITPQDDGSVIMECHD